MVSRKVSGESLSDELFATKRNLWESGFECEQFEARDLLTSESFSGRIAAIESLCTDGIVVITGMEAPSSLNLEDAGKPLERIANALAGKLYQHPRRKSTTGVMRKNMITNNTKHLADYQLDQKLAMHNDHAFFEERVATGNVAPSGVLQQVVTRRSRTSSGTPIPRPSIYLRLSP